MQLVLCKRLTLPAASIFVTEDLFMYIYFALFEENHQNRISRAGEKISPTISIFSHKMIAQVLKFSCAKRFKDWTSLSYNSESSMLAGSKLPSLHVCLHLFQCTPYQNNRLFRNLSDEKYCYGTVTLVYVFAFISIWIIVSSQILCVICIQADLLCYFLLNEKVARFRSVQ